MAYLIPARGRTGLGRAGSEAASNAFVADLTDQAPDFRGLLVGAQPLLKHNLVAKWYAPVTTDSL